MFTIKNKKTNEYFAGFMEDGDTLWMEKSMAVLYETELFANAQSQLLKRTIKNVQLKPEYV